jgi:hypothetical protein
LVSALGPPAVDSMTVAGAGRDWIDQQWLGQLLLYRTWQIAGYAGVTIATAFLSALGLTLLLHLLVVRGAPVRRAIKWTTLALAGSLVVVTARTQDFAYPLFMLLVILVVQDTGRQALDRRIPGHTPAVVEPARVGTHRRRSALLALPGGGPPLHPARPAAATWQPQPVAPFTTLLTPYGLETVRYYQAILGNSAIRDYSAEWQPAYPTNLAAIGYFAVIATVCAVIWRSWRAGVRPSPEHSMIAAAFAVAGLYALRWDSWASFLCVVLAVDVLNRLDRAEHSERRDSPWMLVAVVGIATVALVVGILAAAPSSYMNHAPLGALQAATDYASTHPDAHILADDRSSSALLWLHPALAGRVAFDGRLEVFRQSDVRAWAAYIRATLASLSLTRRYQVFVTSKANAALCNMLRAMPNTRTLYSGPDGLVVVRE